jgi:hypothetical protein
MIKKVYIPVTPAGTYCDWLSSKTEEKAWERLMEDAKHMPYGTKENFIKRGYRVEKCVETI